MAHDIHIITQTYPMMFGTIVKLSQRPITWWTMKTHTCFSSTVMKHSVIIYLNFVPIMSVQPQLHSPPSASLLSHMYQIDMTAGLSSTF